MLKELTRGLRYSLYLSIHPFKGFWDLKHEKKGNPCSAGAILALVVLSFVLGKQFTGFIFTAGDSKSFNLWIQIAGVLAPFALWCISNWCITTLVDGEGRLVDIFMASAYALIPLVLTNIPAIVFSRLLSQEEAGIYTVFGVIGILWTAFLFVTGIMTIHQFTMGKTIVTILIAFAGMLVIVFLSVLFLALIQQVVNFISLLANEISMR